jgi:serpin B
VSAPASRFAFTVLVPDGGRYEAFEGGLDADGWNTVIGRLDDSTEVRLSLPPFEFEQGVDLIPLLRAMGVVDAFDATRADLTGMTEYTRPATGPAAQPLFLDLVLHRAFIHVDEEGTEAAAATYVGSRPTAGMPTEPIEVRIDRPFLFAIRDTVTGTLLFLGRVLDPSA